jgi:hypothetical protein
VRAREGAEKRT